ncbi:MAG: Tex-like N-terminal domain-containing protein, partial [Oscillospiraceae bacterium]
LLRQLDERLAYMRGLEKRKTEVIAAIDEQGKMTEDITAALEKATTLAVVEDIYRPYKQKRKTRASVAKARGLQPLADVIFAQNTADEPIVLAEQYIDEEKEVPTAQDALNGALDIIAETISDDATMRAKLRNFYAATALVVTRATDAEKESVYSPYYEFSQPANKIASHRVLAIDRGEKEGFLKASCEVFPEKAVALITNDVVTAQNACGKAVTAAAEDAYTRLIHPSLERELRTNLTAVADEGAIKVFSQNLRQLLLQPPIKGKVALSLDPGYRMGCKVAVVDKTGKVLDTAVVFPVPEFKRVDEAKAKVKDLIKKHKVEIIAVGNGTASKETEIFTVEVIKELAMPVSYMMVNEAGASVYSASKLGAEEFPQYDVN